MPRYLQIPSDVKLVLKATGEPQLELDPQTRQPRQKTVSFREFVFGALAHSPTFCTLAGARALMRLERALDDLQEGFAVLDEDVWALLKGAAEKPSYQVLGPGGPQTVEGLLGYSGVGLMQLLPFVDAVLGAPAERPAALHAEPISRIHGREQKQGA